MLFEEGFEALFGYVKPFRPELRVKELDAYKAVYCGLCGQLGKSFGPAARLTLNYDFTFISMLRWSVSGEHPAVERRRCHLNPFRKLPVCAGGEPLELGADIAAIMLYYKLLDNLGDDGFPRSLGWRLLRPLAGHARKKAARSRPECEEIVAEAIGRQSVLEKERPACADAACEPFALALSGIFRLLSERTADRRVLERLGYLIGRYVYLIDALDDMERDVKTGSYNPFALRHGLGAGGAGDWRAARDDAAASIFLTIGEAEKTLALLTLRDFAPIIENIVTMGLRASVEEVLAGKSAAG